MICFVDYRTTKEELVNIEKQKLYPIIVPKTEKVYKAINGHVDIQLNIINKQKKLIIVQKDISNLFLHELEINNINYLLSSKSLGSKYPEDIILNALILDDFFLHNLNYTDTTLLETQNSKIKITVKQGYTKCSVLPPVSPSTINGLVVTSNISSIVLTLLEKSTTSLSGFPFKVESHKELSHMASYSLLQTFVFSTIKPVRPLDTSITLTIFFEFNNSFNFFLLISGKLFFIFYQSSFAENSI